jgi:hypothetical protein
MESLKDRFPNVPERIDGLGDLAYNLWWPHECYSKLWTDRRGKKVYTIP